MVQGELALAAEDKDMNRNLSLRIPSEQEQRILNLLRREGLKERKMRNALWSYEGKGVYLSLFPSGILLIQGKEAECWKNAVLKEIEVPAGSLAGCDEAGKGEVFGPLVLCCAVIHPDSYRSVLALAPRDPKKMKEEEIREKARQLKALISLRCVNISPERFNTLYGRYGSVNRLMDEAYSRLVQGVREEFRPLRIVVDAYSPRNPFEGGRDILFEKKAEDRYPEVSVAAIFARLKYLEGLKKLTELSGIELPRGSGISAMELATHLKNTREDLARKLIKMNFVR